MKILITIILLFVGLVLVAPIIFILIDAVRIVDMNVGGYKVGPGGLYVVVFPTVEKFEDWSTNVTLDIRGCAVIINESMKVTKCDTVYVLPPGEYWVKPTRMSTTFEEALRNTWSISIIIGLVGLIILVYLAHVWRR